MEAQGTTPRRLTDLIGSLSDLTSGSGDKGTPIVYVQGYLIILQNKSYKKGKIRYFPLLVFIQLLYI